MAQPLQEWCGWFADAEGAIRPVYDAAGDCVGMLEISLDEFHRMCDREYAQTVALNK
jgi:hypothetical protein